MQKLRRLQRLATGYPGGASAFANSDDGEGYPAIHAAAFAGEPLLVKWFLDNGADATVPRIIKSGTEQSEMSILHELVRGFGRMKNPQKTDDYLQVITLLVKAGADPNVKDGMGRTPLEDAITNTMYGVLHHGIFTFKPRGTTKKKLERMLAFDSLEEAISSAPIEPLNESDVVLDKKSSVVRLYDFFHNEVKGFDPKAAGSVRGGNGYAAQLKACEAEHKLRYVKADYDVQDVRNGGLRQDHIQDLIKNTSLETLREFAGKNRKRTWFLPQETQISAAR